jgi:hypothetical protein
MANGSAVEVATQDGHVLRQRNVNGDMSKAQHVISEEGRRRDQELDKHQKYAFLASAAGLGEEKLTVLCLAGSLGDRRA